MASISISISHAFGAFQPLGQLERATTGTGLWPCRLALAMAMATAGTVTLTIPTYWLWLWLCARVSPGVKYLKATSLQLSLTVVVAAVVAAVIAISKELQKLILLSCRGVMLQCFSCRLPVLVASCQW